MPAAFLPAAPPSLEPRALRFSAWEKSPFIGLDTPFILSKGT